MKLYLSGPMTGIPEKNKPEFDSCAKALREMGHEVVIPKPVKDCEPGTDIWDTVLRKDLIDMLGCEAVITLDSWENSRGARLEVSIAIQVGMRVANFSTFMRRVHGISD
jgi:hypothetical protein